MHTWAYHSLTNNLGVVGLIRCLDPLSQLPACCTYTQYYVRRRYLCKTLTIVYYHNCDTLSMFSWCSIEFQVYTQSCWFWGHSGLTFSSNELTGDVKPCLTGFSVWSFKSFKARIMDINILWHLYGG